MYVLWKLVWLNDDFLTNHFYSLVQICLLQAMKITCFNIECLYGWSTSTSLSTIHRKLFPKKVSVKEDKRLKGIPTYILHLIFRSWLKVALTVYLHSIDWYETMVIFQACDWHWHRAFSLSNPYPHRDLKRYMLEAYYTLV